MFVKDERFAVLSFTGSADTGWNLKSIAGKKKVLLELGGNAAAIVDETADVKEASKKIVNAAFGYAGQSCISVQRVLVHERIYSEFRKLALEETRKIIVGNPMDERTDVGPMINEEAAERIEQWVDEAVEGGAKILCGGKRKWTVYEPTILENVKPSGKCWGEEAFAPIMVIEKISSFEEGLEKTNKSRYGLQAGIFTSNIKRAFRAFNELDVGGVIVNDVPTSRIDNWPYGGIKDSGFGREGVKYAIREMTELKICVLELGDGR